MSKQWKRGLSGADVQAEAEDALEKDINNLSPASNSIADNLDGGVAAVDWASKTGRIEQAEQEVASSTTSTLISVTGSGYIYNIVSHAEAELSGSSLIVSVDGSQQIASNYSSDRGKKEYTFTLNNWDGANSQLIPKVSINTLHRFDTGFTLEVNNQDSTGSDFNVGVTYVLD